MTLGNWVMLEPGTRTRIHLVDHQIVERKITDPFWKVEKTVRTLMFRVDRQDGAKVEKSLSITSERLASEFAPYLEGKAYVNYEWVLEKGPGKLDPPRIAQRIVL